MARKAVEGQVGAAEAVSESTLPTWQAAGLSLAVMVGHVYNGFGALVFGFVSIGVIWTLDRLHRHSPKARSTADLIASVPGAAPTRAITVIQYVAYVLIGTHVANGAASFALVFMIDPDATVSQWSPWWGALLAVAATAVAAVLVGVLSTRLLAILATGIATFGLLVFFYVALAVIARVASGTEPIVPMMGMGAAPGAADLGPAALVVSLAIGFAVFEIPTVVNERLTSVGRPLGYAVVLVTLCAAVSWVAADIGTKGEFFYDAANLVEIAVEMFGEAGHVWLLAATVAQGVAALLVLVWGATRVIRSSVADRPLPLAFTAVMMAVLVLAIASGWGDLGTKLWGVAGILLFVVYLAAAQANSCIDDSNTGAWALLAFMGLTLAVVVFLIGVAQGWWAVGIAAVVVAAAAAWAVRSGRSTAKPVTKPRPESKSQRLSRGNRTS
jgi:hypothetical protein